MNSLEESAKYHDDHLRAIDAWFAQVGSSVHIAVSTIINTNYGKSSVVA